MIIILLKILIYLMDLLKKLLINTFFFKSTNERLSDVITLSLQKFLPFMKKYIKILKRSSEYYVAQYFVINWLVNRVRLYLNHMIKNYVRKRFESSSLNHLQFS